MPELDSFDIQKPIGPSDDAPKSAWQELSSAFVQEARTQLKGLAQTVGAGDLLKVTPDSEHQPEGLLAQHAQMFGHAAADAIPIILTGIAVRAGFGRVLAKSSEPGLLLQRSALGLSTAETATTGFVTGALLHPTDAQNASGLTDFLVDRTKSGASSAVSFMSINAFSHTINSAVSASDSTFARILKNPAASGMLAGIPAGLINPQIDSVVHNGRLNTDFSGTGKSVYESVLIGTAFGGLGALKGVHGANKSIETKSPNAEAPVENYDAQLKFADVQITVPGAGTSSEQVQLSDSVAHHKAVTLATEQFNTPDGAGIPNDSLKSQETASAQSGIEVENKIALSAGNFSLGSLLQKLKEGHNPEAETNGTVDKVIPTPMSLSEFHEALAEVRTCRLAIILGRDLHYGIWCTIDRQSVNG